MIHPPDIKKEREREREAGMPNTNCILYRLIGLPSYLRSTAANRARSPIKSTSVNSSQAIDLQTSPFYTSFSKNSSFSSESSRCNDSSSLLERRVVQVDYRGASMARKAANASRALKFDTYVIYFPLKFSPPSPP